MILNPPSDSLTFSKQKESESQVRTIETYSPELGVVLLSQYFDICYFSAVCSIISSNMLHEVLVNCVNSFCVKNASKKQP